MKTDATATPVLEALAPKMETLRRLTPAELRLVAGGVACAKGTHLPDAKSTA